MSGLVVLVALTLPGAVWGGTVVTRDPPAPALDDHVLQELRKVDTWKLVFHRERTLESSGSGSGGLLFNREETIATWSASSSGSETFDATLLASGAPGCEFRKVCGPDYTAPATIAYDATFQEREEISLTDCVHNEDGTFGPGQQSTGRNVAIQGSAALDGTPGKRFFGGFFRIDYGPNPPRAEAFLFDTPQLFPGIDTTTFAGCLSNAGTSNRPFTTADSVEFTTDDTQVQVDERGLVVRGTTDVASDFPGGGFFFFLAQGAGHEVRHIRDERTTVEARPVCPPADPADPVDAAELWDVDGDALPDCWETEGYDSDGDGTADVDLKAMGASPLHKDIFVELDHMAGHALLQAAAIDTVVSAFALSPVSNPDEKSGINLHVDNGPNSTMNPVTGETWGSRSDADTVAHVDLLGSIAADGNYVWNDFDTIKEANFAAARERVFHYALSAHDFHPVLKPSGVSRNAPGPAALDGASDFLVTLGQDCKGVDCSGPAGHQAGTFMHELGHNLGLHHGGQDPVSDKPNYLSVMNYSFQLSGLVVGGTAGRYDYSRFGPGQIGALKESALDEAAGFGATDPRLAAYNTRTHCLLSGWEEVPVTGAQDWDCQPSPNVVSEDVNKDGSLDTLDPYDDWRALVFDGGAVGLGAPEPLPERTPMIEPPRSVLFEAACLFDPTLDGCPDDSTPPATTTTSTPAANAGGWNKTEVTVMLSATDEDGGSGVKEIVYSLGSDPTVIAGPTARIEITSEGESVLTYFARDNAENAEQAKTLTIRIDKTAPTIHTSRAPDANAAGWNNTGVTGRFTATDGLSGIEGESSFEVVFGEGASQSATRSFTDRAGNSASATIVNVNVDLSAPTMSCVASPDVLWPPDHRLRKVSVRVSIADGLSGAGPFALAAATSSEPDNGPGDGNTTGDVREFGLGLADTEGMLRAERSGSGRGRVYELRYGGGDLAGNTATCVARVAVPLDAARDRER